MKFQLGNIRYMQYVSALAAGLSFVITGMFISWPSPTIPKLKSEDSPIGIILTDEEISWMVSCGMLTSIPASFITRWLVDYFGRKPTLLLTAFTSVACWMCIIFAPSYGILILGRILAGLAYGMIQPSGIIYVGEIAEKDIRGKLSSIPIFCDQLGALIVLVVGPYVSYTTLGVICASASVVFFCAFISMPESPFYYVKTRKFGEAKKSLERLSKKSADEKFLNDRLVQIQETVEEDMKNKTSFIELFTNKDYRWALFLLIGLKLLQQMNGNVALKAYLQPIVEGTNSGLDGGVVSIIIGCIQIPTVYLSGILIDRLGRRPLLLTSILLCFLALFGEGTYFLLQDYLEEDTTSLGWLPTTGLVLFWIAHPIGSLPLPYILLGELFPINVKGAAVSFGVIYGATLTFLVAKFFKPLSNAIGMYSVFYMFAGICLAGAAFVFFFLPETKGKSFREIQEVLRRRVGEKKDVEENLG